MQLHKHGEALNLHVGQVHLQAQARLRVALKAQQAQEEELQRRQAAHAGFERRFRDRPENVSKATEAEMQRDISQASIGNVLPDI